jgi:hypothetical protein
MYKKCRNIPYCGVFTPYKNCNTETRSRDYATVDGAVFSSCRAQPSRAEPNRTVTSRAVLLYVSVIRCECVTQLLKNPIIRTRTRLISEVHDRQVTILYYYIHVYPVYPILKIIVGEEPKLFKFKDKSILVYP